MRGLALEVRVGILILTALAVLGAFVFLLGDLGFGDGYVVYADFDNPGNVHSGAAVLVGGVQVGTVEGVEYLGNKLDPETGRRALVRIQLRLQERVQDTIHRDATFYVTNESLLGERVIGIDPGTPEEPPLKEGAVVDGVDPPRLDLALALAYELLTHIVDLFRNHEEDIEALVTGAASTVTALDEVLTEHRPRIDRIFENVESATVEAGALVTRTRERIDSPQVQRILDNLDHSLAALDRDLGPILSDTRRATTKVNDTLDTFGPKEREQVRTTLRRVSALTDKADGVLSDAQAIVEHVRAGRGTVGAAVMDEELYDDIQELLRDLKHNPWKLFWRE